MRAGTVLSACPLPPSNMCICTALCMLVKYTSLYRTTTASSKACFEGRNTLDSSVLASSEMMPRRIIALDHRRVRVSSVAGFRNLRYIVGRSLTVRLKFDRRSSWGCLYFRGSEASTVKTKRSLEKSLSAQISSRVICFPRNSAYPAEFTSPCMGYMADLLAVFRGGSASPS